MAGSLETERKKQAARLRATNIKPLEAPAPSSVVVGSTTFPEEVFSSQASGGAGWREAAIGWGANAEWQSWVSQNRSTMNELFGRWRPPGSPALSEQELTDMASGNPQASGLYDEYELFRKFEAFRPVFRAYYGKEASREEIQLARKAWGEPENMENFVSFHRQANQTWLKHYGRKINPSEVQDLWSGKQPKLPDVESPYQEKIESGLQKKVAAESQPKPRIDMNAYRARGGR